jgi:hypothetical protein
MSYTTSVLSWERDRSAPILRGGLFIAGHAGPGAGPPQALTVQGAVGTPTRWAELTTSYSIRSLRKRVQGATIQSVRHIYEQGTPPMGSLSRPAFWS